MEGNIGIRTADSGTFNLSWIAVAGLAWLAHLYVVPLPDVISEL